MNVNSSPFSGRVVIDLSHTLSSACPPYPGDPPLEIRTLARADKEGYALSHWSGVFHTGTHMDAPSHFLSDGASIHALAVDLWAGPAWLVDVPEGEAPDLVHVLAAPPPPGIRFLLFRTGWDRYYSHDSYYHDYPVFTDRLTLWLASGSFGGIGLDTPSPDLDPWPAHHALLGKGMVILENLRALDRLPLQQSFDLLCIPLPVMAEASWVRPLALL